MGLIVLGLMAVAGHFFYDNLVGGLLSYVGIVAVVLGIVAIYNRNKPDRFKEQDKD